MEKEDTAEDKLKALQVRLCENEFDENEFDSCLVGRHGYRAQVLKGPRGYRT